MNLSYVIIDTGTTDNDVTANSINAAFDITVTQFTELYGGAGLANQVLSIDDEYNATDSAAWESLELVQLPALDIAKFAVSGVTAATYGGPELVSQITVNAKGIVTLATDVALDIGLTDFTDCTVTSPAANEVLVYSGSVFVNAPRTPALLESQLISSTVSEVDFIGDWSTYRTIELRIYDLTPDTADTGLELTFSKDSGSSWETANTWFYHIHTWVRNVVANYKSVASNTIRLIIWAAATYGLEAESKALKFSTIEFTNLGKTEYTQISAKGHYVTESAGTNNIASFSTWGKSTVTDAYNGIRIKTEVGNIEDVYIELWGINR